MAVRGGGGSQGQYGWHEAVIRLGFQVTEVGRCQLPLWYRGCSGGGGRSTAGGSTVSTAGGRRKGSRHRRRRRRSGGRRWHRTAVRNKAEHPQGHAIGIVCDPSHLLLIGDVVDQTLIWT
jgi:hypothetical protein